MRKRSIAAGLLTGVGSFVLATAAQAQASAPDTQSDGGAAANSQSEALTAEAGGDIVVTAQKRAERLQDVPVSITAFTGETLARAQIQSATEIARQAPNFRVSVLGNEDQPKFSIRGVSTSDFNLNTASPTGVFYDEVYVASQALGGSSLFDVERIEVLRGPQGTLFGKNTTGGAVSIITRAPSMAADVGGYLNLQAGNNDYFHADGALDVPLVQDRLGVRVAFTASTSKGWIDNVTGRDLSTISSNALRFSAKYQDDADFTATLRIGRSRSNPTNIGPIVNGFGPGGVSSTGVNPRINPLTGQPLGQRQGAYNVIGEIRAYGDNANLTLTKGLGDLTLTSITSVIKGQFLNTVDVDGTNLDALQINFADHSKEYSQDLRLSSDFSGPFDFTAGLYYFKDIADIDTDYFIAGHSFTLAQSYRQTRTSYAAYADATLEFAEGSTLYGGLRYTSDHGRLKRFEVVPTIALQPTLKYNDAKPSGRIGLRQKFTNDIMAYAQFSRGYRSSGFNGGALSSAADITVARPEFLNSYEAGIKSQLFDRKLTLNLSAFHYDYRDQQFINVVTVTSVGLVNAGRSKIDGLEAEVILRPAAGLSINAGLGLLDARYTQLVLNGVDLSGNRMIEAPKSTVNFGLDYTAPIGNGDIAFHVDGTAIGKVFFSAQNNQDQAGALFDLNARLSYKASAGWSVGLWAKNLTNNSVVTGAVSVDAISQFTTMPFPRRYGLEVGFAF